MAYQDKRWYCDVGGETIMCNNCVHRKKGVVCEAFPKELMLRGEHDTPFPGDNGIRYKPRETK